MNDIQFWQLIVAVVIGGIVPAAATVSSVRTSVRSIIARLDEMTKHIDKAHDRIDAHVVAFHVQAKSFKR